MKTLLQINLDSCFNKNYYRIGKNYLQITKQSTPTQYPFDNICYTPQDINTSIMYDVILDYSQRVKFTDYIESSLSINLQKNQHMLSPQQQGRKNQNIYSNVSNTLNKIMEENYKEPQYSYMVIYDQIQDNSDAVQSFVKQLTNTEIFRREKISIGHFLIHQNGLYDFHEFKSDLSESEREELKQQKSKNHSIQDNFMWLYNKQINLCEEIRINSVQHIPKTLTYLSVQDFFALSQPTMGVQCNLTKRQDMKNKQLQNKKNIEFYIINIDTKIRIVLALLNYNRNYSLTPQEHKEFIQLLMMHGSIVGQFKYQTIKVQILNILMKNIEKLYYVMYFPGPRLTSFAKETYEADIQHKNTCNLNANRSEIMMGLKEMNKETTQMRNTKLSTQYMKEFKEKTNLNWRKTTQNLANSQIKYSKITHFSRVNNDQQKYNECITQLFENYNALKTEDKENLQKIVKEYLVKKESHLKNQLDKVKERVKQLKLSHRIEQCQVTELKAKCTKALQKISQSFIDLQKMGIKNVQRHMDWLKHTTDEKKQQIKQEEEEIQEINKKIIQGRKTHEYFSKKMVEFRDKLRLKHLQLTKQGLHSQIMAKLSSAASDKQSTIRPQSQVSQLSPQQYQQLEQYKQKLRSKLVEKLKGSQQKKGFFSTLAQIKMKVSKLELAKLQQRYFDLLHT